MKNKYIIGNIALWLMLFSFLTSCMRDDNDLRPKSSMFSSMNEFDCFPDFVQVSGGYAQFYLGLKEDGSVWSWGRGNSYGELGTPPVTAHNAPKKVEGLPEDIKEVYAGNYSSFAITSNGDVWAWGDNYNGSLGIGSSATNTHTPTKVANITNVVSISNGGNSSSKYTLFLKGDGSVWGCGTNSGGELGTGSTSSDKKQTPVPSMLTEGVTSIAICGNGYVSSAVKDGVVYTWGNNVYNLFGDGSAVTLDIENINPLALRAVPTPINLTNIEKINMGQRHAMALSKSGDVYSWGDNTYGAIGDGSTGGSIPIPKRVVVGSVKDICARSECSFAVLQSGGILAWGQNNVGQLGIASADAIRNVPTISSITEGVEYVTGGTVSFYAKKQDGTYWATGMIGTWGVGSNSTSSANIFTKTSCETPVYISAGSDNVFVILNNGDVWAWGNNIMAMLGTGYPNIANKYAPAKIESISQLKPKKIVSGAVHTLILRQDGTVWVCGSNDFGQCGGGGSIIANPAPALGVFDVEDIISTFKTSIIIKNDRSLWTFGGNQMGMLGTGNPVEYWTYTPQKVIDNVKSFKTGGIYGSQITVLKYDGSVWCWGDNSKGQLGIGNIGGYSNIPVQVTTLGNDVAELYGAGSTSSSQTFVRKNDGSIWAWGEASNGVFGSGVSLDQPTPFLQTSMPNQIDNFFAGNNRSFILQPNNNLMGRGDNQYGALGINSFVTVVTSYTFVLNNAKMVSSGGLFTVVVDIDGNIYSSGKNSSGVLGIGDTNMSTFSVIPIRVELK